MSKNISIKEGAQARNFTTQKLKTALQGGGSCPWVPKDEVKLKTKSIREPGVYQAWTDECYGYSKVTVSGIKGDDEVVRGHKVITANGTYEAENDGLYAYDVVKVNVQGGGSAVDPHSGDLTPQTPVSTDPGSSIEGKVVGTDEDGNEAIVEVDDSGKLQTSSIASYINVDTNPTKMNYTDGESIDMTGVVIRGYLKNGTPYIDGSAAESIIPLGQITVNPSNADMAKTINNKQIIKVYWRRSGDNKKLSAQIMIEVTM